MTYKIAIQEKSTEESELEFLRQYSKDLEDNNKALKNWASWWYLLAWLYAITAIVFAVLLVM